MATCIYLPLLLLALHTAAILLPVPRGVSAVSPQILLAGRSFSLSATVDIANQRNHDQQPDTTWRYHLEELHSVWQLRSIVRYRLAGTPPASTYDDDDDELIRGLPAQVRVSGSFYADHEQLLVMNEAARFCEAPAGGRALVERLFTADLLKEFAYEQHLIGAGRLLLFVNAHRDKFERRGSSTEQGDSVVTDYAATLQVAGTDFEVALRYSEQESGVQRWVGIPLSVTIRRRESSGQHARVLRFTFERYYELAPAGQPLFGPLETAASLHWASPIASGDRDQHGQALAFDLFALERAIGCARVLAAPDPAPLDMTRAEPRGFTLTARVDLQEVEEPVQLTVGYEPALHTLKVRKAGATRTTEMLTNFRQNRCYYSTSRRVGTARADLILDSILQVGGADSGKQVESTCVVARASPRRDAGTSAADRDAGDSRYPPGREPVSPHTQGQLLLGADRLVYTGMARVRGIDANVYESYDSQLPVWLQAPAVYQAADDDRLHWRVNSLEGDRAYVLLTSVFYFSRHGRSSDNLLLVEIFKSPRPGLGESDAAAVPPRRYKFTIPIYDFAWRQSGEGQAMAPNGVRLEDFHSLGGDQCLAAASRAHNQYARLSLRLESLSSAAKESAGPAGMLPDWMREPSKRNLALMRALQEQLGVPSQFVYDLDSRYETAASGEARVLPVTLRLAQRQESRSDLHLLGRGQIRPEMRPQLRMFLAYSFQACHMIVAQRKSATVTLFLFDPVRSMCYLFKGGDNARPLPEDDDKKLLEFLVAPSPGARFLSLEAYKIVQTLDITIPKIQGESGASGGTGSGQTIEQLRQRVATVGSLYLADPSLEPPPVGNDEWAPAKSYFKLVKFALDLVNLKSVAQLSDDASGQLVESDSNKFPGFGLVTSGDQQVGDEPSTRAVHARWVPGPTGDRPGQMTHEQCQAACLASADCRAYSTCILDGQLRCLVSSVSFRSASMVAQLMMLGRKPAKAGAIFALDSDNTSDEVPQSEATRQVHVMRHPSCELHNKSYRDLFTALPRRVSSSLAGRILRPVSSAEQCARMCFTSTWEFMRNATSGGGSRMADHIRRKSTHAAIADLTSWAREYRESVCDRFLYLDLDEIKQLGGAGPSALAAFGAQIRGSNFEGPTRGYCVMDKPPEETAQTVAAATSTPTGGAAGSPKKEQQVVEARQFEFNFLMLYEPTQGLSLSESPKSDLERAAYYSVSYGRAASPEEARAITLFLDRGDNSGRARPADSAAECARECFQQLTGAQPWPACRSFSFMEVWHDGRGKRYSFCLHNSITLRQAYAQERFDLVRDRPETQDRICVLENEQVRIWHYDPKPGLVASSLDQVYHIGLDQMGAAAQLAHPAGVHLGPLGLGLSLVLILVLGSTLGVWLGNGCLGKGAGMRANGRLSDADQLVTGGAARRSRPARVVFENAHHKAAD